ncbi:MAG TPA: SDR family oxidoreductase [Gemmatimonadaceae bacterium]|jgi:3-oxoacyl-[acyl-carrier protein] reductase|nr:SDR family oxidoreductase [Gemmatimonadaceae bacterium]
MDLGIHGKVALVAASSKGLGRAVAEELAAEGVNLVLCARGEDTLRSTAEAIRQHTTVKVIDVAADISKPADAERVVKAAFDEFGRVDILVNNSGGPPSAPFESITAEMWQSATQLLLNSVVDLTRAVLPGMKERRWGRILNVTSIAAKQPIEGLMLSNSLRAAVIGFARTLANEVAPFGITVNNLLPGYTKTDRVRQLAAGAGKNPKGSGGDVYAKWEREIPMGRLAEPREFAALAAFLASERASYITGSSIAADGGWIRSLL